MCEPPCPHICKRREQLKAHQETDICVAGQFDKVCLYCKEVVVGSMRTHLERYNCSSKYPCSQCNLSFAKKEQYVEHMKTHAMQYTVVVEQVSF